MKELNESINKNTNLLKKLSLEENLFHKLGDSIDNTAGNGSFLKGLALGGLGLAAFSDPETAEHIKDAISGTGHNLHNFWDNLTGNQPDEFNLDQYLNTKDLNNEYFKEFSDSGKEIADQGEEASDSNLLSKIGLGAAGAVGLTGAGYGLYKYLNNHPTKGLSSILKKSKGYTFSPVGTPNKR